MSQKRELFRAQALEHLHAAVRRDRPLLLAPARRELLLLALILIACAIALAVWSDAGQLPALRTFSEL